MIPINISLALARFFPTMKLTIPMLPNMSAPNKLAADIYFSLPIYGYQQGRVRNF
jgi:hypothetical protein